MFSKLPVNVNITVVLSLRHCPYFRSGPSHGAMVVGIVSISTQTATLRCQSA